MISETLAAYLCGMLFGVGAMVVARYVTPKLVVAAATYRAPVRAEQ